MNREKVVERLVAWIWERQALIGLLPGDDGARYQVVFRGRPWGERGPDFQGAVLARQDGVLLRGDVEVHVRASDWRRHGHGRDPAYNQTVCHVVLWNDERRPTRRQDGVAVPTLELVKHLADSLSELEQRQLAEEGVRPTEPSCLPNPGELGELLERAGLERFQAKSAQLEGDLAGLSADEVLYRASLRAMGYTANTAGFEQLASLLSLAQIRDTTSDLMRVQAMFFGAAGLLPSQRGATPEEGLPRDLEHIWQDLSAALPSPLPRGAWRWWRVRPENLPPRRLAGFSHIVSSWLRFDPVERLLDDLADAERLNRPAHLAEVWRVRAAETYSSTDAN